MLVWVETQEGLYYLQKKHNFNLHFDLKNFTFNFFNSIKLLDEMFIV